MKQLASACVLLVTSPLALANEASFERCHQMSTDYIRLMCYDQETDYKKPRIENDSPLTNGTEPSEKPLGKQWRYSDEISALDNRKDVWLSVISENTEPNSIGSPIRATLWLRCMENRTNFLIGFDRYTTENQSVKYKIDDGNVETQWMETVRGGDGIGIWSGSKAIPFIRKILDKESVVISYRTYTGPVEFLFDISGLRERIEPLSKECGWTP